MKFRTLAATGLAGAFVASGSLTGPAAAHYPPNPWEGYRTTVIDASTIQMTVPSDYEGASLYNQNVDYPVQSGDVISYYLDTQGGTYCTDYYPYLYVEIDGRYFTSYEDGTNCPGGSSSTQDDGRVSFTVRETGTISSAQFYYYDYDQNGTGGNVRISDLRVNGEPIYFEIEPAPEPDPVPVATEYGATISKRPCKAVVFAYHDAAPAGQVASPRRIRFTVRVDGRVRSEFVVRAGATHREVIRVRARTGKRLVTVRRTPTTELMDRTRIRTGRC